MFLKTIIKSDCDKVTDFYDKENSKVDSNHICLAVINLDSALKKDESYNPQMFLNKSKYINKKLIRYITQDKEIFSSDSDEKSLFVFFSQFFQKFQKRDKVFQATETIKATNYKLHGLSDPFYFLNSFLF